jgi:hypothetical protein
MDKVASASTALDRVLGQMDGYEVSAGVLRGREQRGGRGWRSK